MIIIVKFVSLGEIGLFNVGLDKIVISGKLVEFVEVFNVFSDVFDFFIDYD